MSGGFRQRLRLVLGSRPALDASENVDGDVAPTVSPWIQFVAFTEDCRVFGHIQLDSDRLSDTLNGHLEYLLCDVLVESLEDGRSIHADEVPIARDELIAVLAEGPRGDPTRRTHTLAYPVAVQAGPYLIRGNLHALPGVEPLASARRRRPMIPLSDAWIEYRSGGAAQVSSCGTIVVNRETADWIQLVEPAPAKVLGRAKPGATKPVAAKRVPAASAVAATKRVAVTEGEAQA